jgi:hypothetical protein
MSNELLIYLSEINNSVSIIITHRRNKSSELIDNIYQNASNASPYIIIHRHIVVVKLLWSFPSPKLEAEFYVKKIQQANLKSAKSARSNSKVLRVIAQGVETDARDYW